MAMVGVDDSSLQADSQLKSVGLSESRRLLALFYIDQMSQVNSRNDFFWQASTRYLGLRDFYWK